MARQCRIASLTPIALNLSSIDGLRGRRVSVLSFSILLTRFYPALNFILFLPQTSIPKLVNENVRDES